MATRRSHKVPPPAPIEEREAGRSPEIADEEYERRVLTTPGVVEALNEALEEAEALKRPS